jgi:hypothetical protein
MEFTGFAGPAYEARSPFVDCQQSINWFPVVNSQPGAKTQIAMYPTPGLRSYIDVPTLASLTAMPIRGMYSPPSRRELLVVCIGSYLCTFTPSGASFSVTSNAIQSGSGPVSFADNGTTILMVDGTLNGYTIAIADGSFSTITSEGFYGGNVVQFLDGCFVLNKPDTGIFYWSDTYATTFPALNFATAEMSPDLLVAAWVEHREIWLLGQYTSEVWYNSGAGGAETFVRNDGVSLQHGCGAAASISRLGETFAFLATDERGSVTVQAANGYSFVKISSDALDYEMSRYETTSDAIGFTFRHAGREFYQLTFPTANKTWVYDVQSNWWHQRAYLNTSGRLDRHRANCFANYQGRVLVGDHTNGLVYEYAENAYTDNGNAIARVRRAPHIYKDRQIVSHSSLQIEFEPGVGLQTGQGNDPQAMLRYSNDGGKTWSKERWTTIGKVGKYKNRAIWRRLGSARDRVYEVRVTDPVNAVIVGATLEVS